MFATASVYVITRPENAAHFTVNRLGMLRWRVYIESCQEDGGFI